MGAKAKIDPSLKRVLVLIGRNVRLIRDSQGLTQEGLADRAGLDTTHLGLIERGTQNPSIEMLIRLAEALNVRWVDFGAENIDHLIQSSRTER